jgi:hypothetical protein
MATLSVIVACLLGSVAGDAATEARGVALRFFEALSAGDAEAALALVARPSAADRLVVRTLAVGQQGLSRFGQLASSHLGERADLGINAHRRSVLAAIERAPVEVDGDHAVLHPSGEPPVRLVRAKGSWKVESPVEQVTAGGRTAFRNAFQKTQEAAKGIAERMRSAALQGAQDVREGLRNTFGRKSEEDGVWL